MNVGGMGRAVGKMGAVLGGAAYKFVNAEAAAVAAAFTTPPTNARKKLIDNLVGALKSAGIWALLDIFYVMAAADSQAGRLNWKSPGSFTLSPANSPSFTADRGFTGDGATSRLDTQWAAATNGVNFAQNSNSVWVWSLTDGQNVAVDIGRAGGLGQYDVRCWSNSGNETSANSDAGDAGMAQTSGLGFFGGSRLGAAQKRLWRNGAQVGTDIATASAAISAGNAWLCGANSVQFSSRKEAAAAFGASLAGIESAFYSALLTYMQAVGAA